MSALPSDRVRPPSMQATLVWRLATPVARVVLTVILLAATLFPFLWILDSSLKNAGETHTFPPTFFPREWTLDPYREVLSRHHFLSYVGNSLVIAIGSTLWSVALAA